MTRMTARFACFGFVFLFIFLSEGALSGAEKNFVNSLGMRFVLVPAGSFMMGSHEPPSAVATNRAYGDVIGKDRWYAREHPLHKVTLSRPFLLQETEVTVAQFRSFVAATGFRTDAEREGWGWAYDPETGQWIRRLGVCWHSPGFDQSQTHPVTYVSWTDARVFIDWLNRKEKTVRYRLPSEAEWEYACRAGTKTPFYWGREPDGRYANFADGRFARIYPQDAYVNRSADDGHGFAAPVGSYLPNPLGLYDMSGNVNEWCQDWYGQYTPGETIDSMGPARGRYRVLRGGSWCNFAAGIRSANRGRNTPGYSFSRTGFRLAWTP